MAKYKRQNYIKDLLVFSLIYQKIGTVAILLTGKYICHTLDCIRLKALVFIF